MLYDSILNLGGYLNSVQYPLNKSCTFSNTKEYFWTKNNNCPIVKPKIPPKDRNGTTFYLEQLKKLAPH